MCVSFCNTTLYTYYISNLMLYPPPLSVILSLNLEPRKQETEKCISLAHSIIQKYFKKLSKQQLLALVFKII